MNEKHTDAAEEIPAALLSRSSVRRGSVFTDLLTIFRRNSSFPRNYNHIHRPSASASKREQYAQ